MGMPTKIPSKECNHFLRLLGAQVVSNEFPTSVASELDGSLPR